MPRVRPAVYYNRWRHRFDASALTPPDAITQVPGREARMAMPASEQCLAAFCVLLALGTSEAAAQANCAAMRKIDIGISVAPPNVVHTSPFVASELGYFT